MKPMTNLELHNINMRVYQIETLLDDEYLPDDVFDSLVSELDEYIIILKKEEKLARIRESGLKLVS